MSARAPSLSEAQIADLTEDAINAIAKLLQDRLGITDGGPASIFYCEEEERARVADRIRAYLAFEDGPSGAHRDAQCLTFAECADLKVGQRVQFPVGHDIFPETVIPEGATGIITDNSLNASSHNIGILLDDPVQREALKTWEGIVWLGDDLDPAADRDNDAEWQEQSPIRRLEAGE